MARLAGKETVSCLITTIVPFPSTWINASNARSRLCKREQRVPEREFSCVSLIDRLVEGPKGTISGSLFVVKESHPTEKITSYQVANLSNLLHPTWLCFLVLL